jgi:hypothetical protein
MNALLDRDTSIKDLDAHLQRQRRAVIRFGAVRILLAALAFFTNALGAAYASISSRMLGLTLFTVGSAVHFYYILRMLPLAVEAFCYRIGFVCPYCVKPLHPTGAAADHPLWQCPSCFQRIEPPFPAI